MSSERSRDWSKDVTRHILCRYSINQYIMIMKEHNIYIMGMP